MESALDRLNRLSASGESDQAPDALLASQSSPRFGAFPSAAAGGSYSSVYASYSSSFAASAAKTSANPPSHGSAAQSPTSTHQYR